MHYDADILLITFEVEEFGDHTHTFETDWSFDANNHWHAATCAHKDEISDKAAHNMVDEACTVCDYALVTAPTFERLDTAVGTLSLLSELLSQGFATVNLVMNDDLVADDATFDNRISSGDYMFYNGNLWLTDEEAALCWLFEIWTSSGDNPSQLGKGAHADLAMYDLDLTPYGGEKIEDGTWAETYDVLIAAIEQTTDEQARYEMFHLAENMLMDTGCVTPLYYRTHTYEDYHYYGLFCAIWNVNADLLPGSALTGVAKEQAQQEIRKAVSLAFDRQMLVERIGVDGRGPANTFVAKGVTDYDGSLFYDNTNGGNGYYALDDYDANVAQAVEILETYYHIHTYSDEWESDGNGHWHEAICCDGATSAVFAHNCETNICSVCGLDINTVPNKTIELIVNDDGTLSLPEGVRVFVGDTVIVPRERVWFSGDYYLTDTDTLVTDLQINPSCYSIFRREYDGEKHMADVWDSTFYVNDSILHENNGWTSEGATLSVPGTYVLRTVSGYDPATDTLYDMDGSVFGVFEVEEFGMHEHPYATDWSYDDQSHWHVATCEHTDRVADRALHTLKGGVCTVCKADINTIHPKTVTLLVNDDGTLSLPDGVRVFVGDTLIVPRGELWCEGDFYIQDTETLVTGVSAELSSYEIYRYTQNGYEEMVGCVWDDVLHVDENIFDPDCGWKPDVGTMTVPGTYIIRNDTGYDPDTDKVYDLNADLLITFEVETFGEHVHTFSTEWSADGSYHWHAATCEHTDEVRNKALHTIENGVCTVCNTDINALVPKTVTFLVNADGTASVPDGVEIYVGDTIVIPRKSIQYTGDFVNKETGETETDITVVVGNFDMYLRQASGDKLLGGAWSDTLQANSTISEECWKTTDATMGVPGIYVLKLSEINGTGEKWASRYQIDKELAVFEIKALPGTEHTHTFSTDWSSDESGHWYTATCEHTDEVADYGVHTLENGICTVCDYDVNAVHPKTITLLVNDDGTLSLPDGVRVFVGDTIVVPRGAMSYTGDFVNQSTQATEAGITVKANTYSVFRSNEWGDLKIATLWANSFTVDTTVCANGSGWQATDQDMTTLGTYYLVLASGTKDGVNYTTNIPLITFEVEEYGATETPTDPVDPVDPVTHEHTFSTDWSSDASNHWHAATCEHTDEVADYGAHVFENGVCTVCGFVRQYSENLTFTENGTGYTVSGIGTCTDTDIVIPPTYNNEPVTEIGENAFSPDGNNWNAQYYAIESVAIPDSVTVIGSCAFKRASGLTSVSIPESVMIIGDEAFSNCHNLSSIAIPNGVKRIGIQAFYHCENITAIDIPDSVIAIGDNAFTYCTGLTTLAIPESTVTLGGAVISACSNLTSVSIPEKHMASYLSKGSSFAGCGKLKSITIPDDTTVIGDDAFNGCYSLASLTIPEGVTNIGDRAFRDCTKLTTITIPDSVTSIGVGLFLGCAGLTSITIPDSLRLFEKYNAVSYCTSLTSVEIPSNITAIGHYTFSNSGLESIDIPYGVTMLDNNAFSECKNLTSVTIPNSVLRIQWEAFRGCINLRTITIPGSVGANILEGAFSDCTGLTSVTFLEGATSVGLRMFDGCYNLTSVVVPRSVQAICDKAFYNCYSLTDIYYAGSKEEWAQIIVGSDNEMLLSATVHYNHISA